VDLRKEVQCQREPFPDRQPMGRHDLCLADVQAKGTRGPPRSVGRRRATTRCTQVRAAEFMHVDQIRGPARSARPKRWSETLSFVEDSAQVCKL